MEQTTENAETLMTDATDITESTVSSGEAEVQNPKGEEPKASNEPEAKSDEKETSQDDAKAQEPKDVAYEFTPPEGVDMAPETLEGVTGLARELGLSNEQGQKLVDFGGNMLKQWSEQLQEQQTALTSKWAEEVQADKEIGGDNLKANQAKAIEVRKKVFPDNEPAAKEFKDFLNETGLGNHPVLLKAFVRMHSIVGDDTMVSGDAAPVAEKTRAEKLFGN